MHKQILKMFGFLRSFIQFIKVIIVFLVMMLSIYWMQDLSGSNWGWLCFISPVLDLLLDISANFISGSISIFNIIVEYKYLGAFGILLFFFFFSNFMIVISEKIEELYCDGRRAIKKIEEKNLNKSLEKQILAEQKKLKLYKVFVSASVKAKIAHREFKVDMEEQNRIMLKFLMEKTGCTPIKEENGFLFEFRYFDDIDKSLDAFAKLLQSKAPLDYIICVQVFGEDIEKEREQLIKLRDLKILNKIVSFADTIYRYNFNNEKAYKTSMVGLFQKGEESFEVHEFIKRD